QLDPPLWRRVASHWRRSLAVLTLSCFGALLGDAVHQRTQSALVPQESGFPNTVANPQPLNTVVDVSVGVRNTGESTVTLRSIEYPGGMPSPVRVFKIVAAPAGRGETGANVGWPPRFSGLRRRDFRPL